jgi:hypothetical protein
VPEVGVFTREHDFDLTFLPGSAARRPPDNRVAEDNQAPAAGEVRLYLNQGRKDGVSPDEIAALLASAGVTVPATAIDTMKAHSYINVDSADGEKLCAGLVGRERNGRAIMCEPARPPRRR